MITKWCKSCKIILLNNIRGGARIWQRDELQWESLIWDQWQDCKISMQGHTKYPEGAPVNPRGKQKTLGKNIHCFVWKWDDKSGLRVWDWFCLIELCFLYVVETHKGPNRTQTFITNKLFEPSIKRETWTLNSPPMDELLINFYTFLAFCLQTYLFIN